MTARPPEISSVTTRLLVGKDLRWLQSCCALMALPVISGEKGSAKRGRTHFPPRARTGSCERSQMPPHGQLPVFSQSMWAGPKPKTVAGEPADGHFERQRQSDQQFRLQPFQSGKQHDDEIM